MDNFFDGLDKNNNVIIKPYLLALGKYRKIWDRDTSTNKQIALKELTYIWAMCCRDSKENPYNHIEDRKERHDVLSDDIFGGSYNPDDSIVAAIELYMQRYPISYYERKANQLKGKLDKELDFIESFDMNERTDSGSLVMKPKERLDAYNETISFLKRIKEIEQLAKEEMEQRSKIIGGTEANMFEEPVNALWLEKDDISDYEEDEEG